MEELRVVKGTKRKAASSIKWNKGLALSLIKQYEQHPNLWNTSSEDYKNKILRRTTVQVSAEMGIPSSEIADKIHNSIANFSVLSIKF